MKLHIFYLLFVLALLIFSPDILYAADTSKIIPAPVPVNITPGKTNETNWGLGYNFLRLNTEWKDDFYRYEGTETIGDIQSDVHNIVFVYMETMAGRIASEYDIMLGIIRAEGATGHYYSDKMAAAGQEPRVNVEHSGDGYDVGIRYLSSIRLFDKASKGEAMIEWNLSYSLHAAIFYLENWTLAETADGAWREEYEEEEWGIFLRPVVALQPVIHLSERFTFVPYVGAGTMLIASSYYWWNVGDYIEFSTEQNGQKAEGTGTASSYTGLEGYIGFDFGINLESENTITFGGVFSKFVGGDEADFFEFHLVYSMPW